MGSIYLSIYLRMGPLSDVNFPVFTNIHCFQMHIWTLFKYIFNFVYYYFSH